MWDHLRVSFPSRPTAVDRRQSSRKESLRPFCACVFVLASRTVSCLERNQQNDRHWGTQARVIVVYVAARLAYIVSIRIETMECG